MNVCNDCFSLFMNKPIPSVRVWEVYYDNVESYENPFTVKEIIERDSNYYALCSHIDEFSGDVEEVEVYCFNLSKEKEL